MSNSAPVIAVTSSFSQDEQEHRLGASYTRSVEKAGGLPVIVPVWLDEGLGQQLLARSDGLLLTGGVDVAPLLFGEEPVPGLGTVDPDRDRVELELARRALEDGLPVFAICRGIQVLNLAAGGSLYQDLDSQYEGALQHRQKAPRWHASHTVQVEADSLLAACLDTAGTTQAVNSYHHQAVKEPAGGLVVSATSPDGVIEAMEGTGDQFVLAVQWHPEGMVDRHPPMLNLFKAFVRAAAGGRETLDSGQ